MEFVLRKKGVWLFIFNKAKINQYVKPTIKKLGISILAIAVILEVFLIRYKPAYAVIYNDQIIGYVNSKDDFNNLVNNTILTPTDSDVAFVSLGNISYKFEYSNISMVDDNLVLDTLKNNSKNIYRVYEVSNGDEFEPVYYNNIEEAQSFINTLKTSYNTLSQDLTLTPIYLENSITEDAIKIAKEKIINNLNQKQEEAKIQSKSLNGVYFAVAPVSTGKISSRFGSRESIRNHVHKGIDIAARNGTAIKAAASGTVKNAGFNNGGYGNLVIIDHGNGIETYYGHCSKIYVSVGQTVNAGDLIAAVGSTGNSTGNHLHFEIRNNGSQVNPQNYLY